MRRIDGRIVPVLIGEGIPESHSVQTQDTIKSSHKVLSNVMGNHDN